VTTVQAIVPAYNEASRIATVLRVLKSALAQRVIDDVVVVDDGSRDDTVQVAEREGVRVIRLTPNRGKGGAMRFAVEQSVADIVLFIDADLKTLTVDHVRSLVEPVRSGEWDMVAGLRDYGEPRNTLQLSLPIITGERAVRRQFLLRVPDSLWSGYKIETAINDVVYRTGGRAGTVLLHGLTFDDQVAKKGVNAGAVQLAKMYAQVLNGTAEVRQSMESQAQLSTAPPSVTAECTTLGCVTDTVAGSLIKAAVPVIEERGLVRVAGQAIGEQLAERWRMPVMLASIGMLFIGVGAAAWGVSKVIEARRTR